MSDDEADPELLELLRQRLGIGRKEKGITSDTHVLRDAEYIYSNAIDVAIDRHATVAAAHSIWSEMQRRAYSRSTWAEHELHPKTRDLATLNFIFTMDLLNFSFWSDLSEDKRWSVFYRGKRWTGYWSLVACLQRALDEGIPITDPTFWVQPVLPHAPSAPAAATADNGLAINDDPPRDTAAQPEDPAAVETTQPTELQVAEAVEALKIDDDQTPQDADGDVLIADKGDEDPLPLQHLTAKIMSHVFRGDGDEPMPLLAERFSALLEAGQTLDRVREHVQISTIRLG